MPRGFADSEDAGFMVEIHESLKPLVLASASPRRRDILLRLGLDFEVCPSSVEEDAALLHSGGGEAAGPARAAEHLAILKARAVAADRPVGTIIGSDTVVAVGETMLGKPASREDAHRILSFLSGKTQEVISGICLIHGPTGVEISGFDVTRVFTKPMTGMEIEEYIATGECFGKAGAYAIQETGDRFVERIEGSFDTVVGFPTELFLTLMEDLAEKVREKQDVSS